MKTVQDSWPTCVKLSQAQTVVPPTHTTDMTVRYYDSWFNTVHAGKYLSVSPTLKTANKLTLANCYLASPTLLLTNRPPKQGEPPPDLP